VALARRLWKIFRLWGPAVAKAAPALEMRSPHQESLRHYILFLELQTATGRTGSAELHLKPTLPQGEGYTLAPRIRRTFIKLIEAGSYFWEMANHFAMAQSVQTQAIFALSAFIEKNQTPQREHRCAL